MKKSYSEKLKDPRWQKKRLEILNRSNFKCDNCESEEKTLHVHHAIYLRGREPWEYDSKYLHSLCQECHEDREELENNIRTEMADMRIEELDSIFCSVFFAIHEFGTKVICHEVDKIHKKLQDKAKK